MLLGSGMLECRATALRFRPDAQRDLVADVAAEHLPFQAANSGRER
jgi:hypothetical protein